MLTPRAALFAALAIALAGAPGAARADEDMPVPAKARQLAERGRAMHDAGDYAAAIAAFTQAYVIAPSPALLFNLAQAYRLEGNCDDAALMYQRYLATSPSPEGRALAEGHLANVERCLHKIALHIPTDNTMQTASLVPAPPAAAFTIDAPPNGPSHRAQVEKDIGVGLIVGGSAALGAALYYAIDASNASNDVSSAESKGGKGKNVGALDNRGQSAASDAQILAVGGAVGVAGGIVMYVLGKRDEQSPVVVAPVSHGGASVAMRWTF